jgi:hypothetical protein
VAVQQRESCDHNAPSRKQQQESAKFHEWFDLFAGNPKVLSTHDTTWEIG